MTASIGGSGSFGEINFGTAALGDARRNRRLVRLANQIYAHPEGTLPQKISDPASYQAMYRLCKSQKVTHAVVLKPHRQLTLQKMQTCNDIVLVIHDTTELDFTSRTSLHDELGQIGNGKGKGYECHNSIAMAASSGEILGLANQILHHRANVQKNEGVAAKREREDRESLLWLRGSQAIGTAPPQSIWVNVCDRGADTFEFLDDQETRGCHYLIRSQKNRTILRGHGDEIDDEPQTKLLHDDIRNHPAWGGVLIWIPARDGSKARFAKCLISAAAVRIVPPHVRRGKHGKQPIASWVVRVWEIDSPHDVDGPLEWILLTNFPVLSLEDATTRIQWYEKRWTVEDYHKALKTGLGIEKLQFDSIDRLEPMIALLSVIATMLVNLRYEARNEETANQSASQHVPPTYIAVLTVWRYSERRTDVTVYDFYMALARLGGHQNRKSDGPPGWITLWRGWNKLQQMVDYAIKAGVEKM